MEGVGRRGENFKHAERPAKMTQRGYQDRAHSQVAAGRQVDSGAEFGVGAQHNFAGADALGGESTIRLQTAANIRSGAPGAGTTNNRVALAQGDSGASGTRQGLGFFRGGAADGFVV